ncbi:MAG: hypothetical protein ACO1N0_01510 [Fluviicola sp.]
MRKSLLVFILLASTSAFGQIGVQGAFQIFDAVYTLGREVVQAAEFKKSKKEQQANEAEYMTTIQRADSFFVVQKYPQAIEQYNRALELRRDEYPIEQINRSNTELTRLNNQNFERNLDTADAHYTNLKYTEAIRYYSAALEIRDEEYPRARIEQAEARREFWKTVHFSSVLISDSSITAISSQAFSTDSYSNFLPKGQYPVLNGFSWGPSNQTPNGIAVPSNVRLVIYSEPYFKGKVLADVLGPAIINNSSKKSNNASLIAHSKTFGLPLQTIFPQTVRIWSTGDMKDWYKGSMEISEVK